MNHLTTSPAKPVSPIESLTDSLGVSLNELIESIASLEGQLSPVLSPPSPQPASVSEVVSENLLLQIAPLCLEMGRLRGQIMSIQERVSDLRNRLVV